jgi:hypothetical protein
MRGNFPYIECYNTDTLKDPSEMEKVLQLNSDMIDQVTWIPFVGDNVSPTYNTMIYDDSKTLKWPVGMYGVLPNVFSVARDDFLKLYSTESGLPIGESFYTAAGS